jgi:hypothetical protein
LAQNQLEVKRHFTHETGNQTVAFQTRIKATTLVDEGNRNFSENSKAHMRNHANAVSVRYPKSSFVPWITLFGRTADR